MSDAYTESYRKKQLVGMLYGLGSVKRGQFKLSSGKTSEFYLDCRIAALDPGTLKIVCPMLGELISEVSFDSLGCPEGPGSVSLLGALLLGYELQGHAKAISGFVVRKKAKDHGTAKMVEGEVGTSPVLIDDVATSGKSLLHAIDKMGVKPLRVVVVLDRNQGAAQSLRERGVELRSVLTMADLIV